MSVGNINLKDFTTVFKRVEESYNSAKEREGNNFYQKQEKKKNLPEKPEELFKTISMEVAEFMKQPFVMEQGRRYVAVKDGDKVYVVVKDYKGDTIRHIEPEEFLNIAKSYSGSKGGLINSVT